jgi:site-specific recombinase XerD
MSLGDDRLARSKFRRYLMDRCGLKYSTTAVYIWSLNTLSKYLNDTEILDCSLYDIKNIHRLLDLKTKLSESEVFRIVNSSCNGNLVPSLRHYYDFMASSKDSDHTSDSHTRVTFQRGQ